MVGSTIATSVQDGLDRLARHARMVLVVLAGLSFGGAAFFYLAGEGPVASQLVSGTVFALLAVWARRSPMVPIVIGVSLHGLGLLTVAFVDLGAVLSFPSLLMNGIILALCINGIATARSYEHLKVQLAGK